MKYIFQLSCRAVEQISMEIIHDKFIERLKGIEGAFGIPKEIDCPPPKFGSNILATFILTNKLAKGLRGHINYVYRNKLTDEHSSDDTIWIEFNSKSIDFSYLVNYVIYEFVQVFQAYEAVVYPEKLIYDVPKFPFEITSKINRRNSLDFFYPFMFMDENLARRSLKLTLNELYNKLNGEIFKVDLFENGIWLIAANNYLSVADALAFNEKIQELLNIKLPVGEVYDKP